MANNTIILLRNDTAANWSTDNPTLAAGEMGLETDTNKFKFGDGSTAWNSLAYAGGSAGAFKYGYYTLSANQTSRVAEGNHIEFNTSDGSLGGLSTGSGQENGLVTLPVGKTYKIMATARAGCSATNGYIGLRIYDETNSSYMGRGMHIYAMGNSTSTNTDGGWPCLGIVTPTTNIQVSLKITGDTSTNTIYASATYIFIEEYGGY